MEKTILNPKLPTKTLHLVTQENQPFGSTRMCCQNCGLAISAMGDDQYADSREAFTHTLANGYDGRKYKRC